MLKPTIILTASFKMCNKTNTFIPAINYFGNNVPCNKCQVQSVGIFTHQDKKKKDNKALALFKVCISRF